MYSEEEEELFAKGNSEWLDYLHLVTMQQWLAVLIPPVKRSCFFVCLFNIFVYYHYFSWYVFASFSFFLSISIFHLLLFSVYFFFPCFIGYSFFFFVVIKIIYLCKSVRLFFPLPEIIIFSLLCSLVIFPVFYLFIVIFFFFFHSFCWRVKNKKTL